MGESIQISTGGLHCIGAWLEQPATTPKGGVVVVQEVFGVNAYIREVAARWAAAGFTAIAPMFFDHVETGLELDPSRAAYTRGRAAAMEVGFERAVEDVASAAEAISSAGRIGCVGYCWGGTVALLAAQRLGLPAVSYYGSRNVQFLDLPLQAPVMFHFGSRDATIPPEAVERHRQNYPDAAIHVYAGAGHAFDRESGQPGVTAGNAALAFERSTGFFNAHLGPP